MVFYYSATGNCRWIAKKIAAALNDKAVDIVGEDPKAYSFSERDSIGFVWPVFSCAAPVTMVKFANGIHANGAYTFSVCSYSNFSDRASACFSRDALPMASTFGMIMPDNTAVFGSAYDTEETTLTRLASAEERLAPIIDQIKKRTVGVAYEENRGPGNGNFTLTLPPFYWMYRSFTTPFSVQCDKCVSCGLCVKRCPVQAIELRDGKPVWVKERCEKCGACINCCPKEAITFGEWSKGQYRYTFEKFYKKLENK